LAILVRDEKEDAKTEYVAVQRIPPAFRDMGEDDAERSPKRS